MAKKKTAEILESKETPVEPVKVVTQGELLETWSEVVSDTTVSDVSIENLSSFDIKENTIETIESYDVDTSVSIDGQVETLQHVSTKQPFPELKQSKDGGLTFYDIA